MTFNGLLQRSRPDAGVVELKNAVKSRIPSLRDKKVQQEYSKVRSYNTR